MKTAVLEDFLDRRRLRINSSSTVHISQILKISPDSKFYSTIETLKLKSTNSKRKPLNNMEWSFNLQGTKKSYLNQWPIVSLNGLKMGLLRVSQPVIKDIRVKSAQHSIKGRVLKSEWDHHMIRVCPKGTSGLSEGLRESQPLRNIERAKTLNI